MIGTLKVNEADEGFKQKSVTSKFYRLEKKFHGIHDYYDVYEFYTVCNGNYYYRHHEEPIYHDRKRYLGAIFPDKRLGRGEEAKDKGNKLYQELKDNGYKFVGIYECDISGYAKRIQ